MREATKDSFHEGRMNPSVVVALLFLECVTCYYVIFEMLIYHGDMGIHGCILLSLSTRECTHGLGTLFKPAHV